MAELAALITAGGGFALIAAVLIGVGSLLGVQGRQWSREKDALLAQLERAEARADAEEDRRRQAEDELREEVRDLRDQVAAAQREIAHLRAQLGVTP